MNNPYLPSKLGFDSFLDLLGAMGREIYGDTNASLLCLVLQCLLAHKLQEPQYRALLDSATSSAITATHSSSEASSTRSPPADGATSSRVVVAGASPVAGSGAHRDARGVFVLGATSSPVAKPSSGAGAAPSASVHLRPASSTAHPVLEFLEKARLGDYFAPICEWGARQVEDLAELNSSDFLHLGMKDLQIRRLKEALAQHSTPLGSLADAPAAGAAAAAEEAAAEAAEAAAESAAAAPASSAPPQLEEEEEHWDVRVCVCVLPSQKVCSPPQPPPPPLPPSPVLVGHL
jgi:hypothetical protein